MGGFTQQQHFLTIVQHLHYHLGGVVLFGVFPGKRQHGDLEPLNAGPGGLHQQWDLVLVRVRMNDQLLLREGLFALRDPDTAALPAEMVRLHMDQDGKFVAEVGDAVGLHVPDQEIGAHSGIAQGDGMHRHGQASGLVPRIAAPVHDAVAVQDHSAQIRTGEPIMHVPEQLGQVRTVLFLVEVQTVGDGIAIGEGAHIVAFCERSGELFERRMIGPLQRGGVTDDGQGGAAIMRDHQDRFAHLAHPGAHHGAQ
ncbi:MAG: hypothetical protein IPI07_05600 [Flavobacteriales bacterium]|nr:hypothetical protein [Flavobacteriales bacterium]